MSRVIEDCYPDDVRTEELEEVDAISISQYVPKVGWSYELPTHDRKSSESSHWEKSDLESRKLGIPSPPVPRHASVSPRKFRLSRSPLDNLQAEFRKYSALDAPTDLGSISSELPSSDLEKFQMRRARVIQFTDEFEMMESNDHGIVIPEDMQHADSSPIVPDWSFVQRRVELPDQARNSDCPSMTTGSTISSRNSSTRSTKSIRWDGLEQQHPDKGLCPFPGCGRVLKDLAAHMLTHQAERPEKCPVDTCDYHTKGFARAYDRVKHTITHLKGTMVCGFCPGSGSSTEQVFNRCDVFLRHLVSVHGVEPAPASRREELYRTGTIKQPRKPLQGHRVATCGLCSEPFDAQGFYEHLRGCALRQVTRSCTALKLEHAAEKPPAEQQTTKGKDSPRNDSIVTSELRSTPKAFPVENRYKPLGLSVPSQDTNLHESLAESREIAELTASSRCLSLTSSNGEAMKSSDEETDWTEDAGSPDSAPDPEGLPPLLSPVKRQLVESIMREFHRIFDKSLRAHGGGGGTFSSAGSGYYSGSSGSSTYSSSSFISRKRSLSGGSSPPPDDNGDDSHKRRRPDPKSSGKQSVPELRFACPYYKRNPGRHQTFTSCRDPGFITVARLKEHLYRRHLLPIQCNRCCSTFANEPMLREHQRDPNGCEIREQIPLEGFDKDQERKLKSKKRSLVYQSEEDKWKGVYRILFPDDNEADMPSPYIEYHPCNVGQVGEPSNVARFQEFSRLELPRLVRRTLEVAVEEEAQPLEEKLRERLVDIVRECQSQLISMFQSTTTPGQTTETSELTPALMPTGLPSTHDSQRNGRPGTTAPFPGFDSYATTAADFIPIPAAMNYRECEQPAMKPEPSPAGEGASGSPDSGYDSTWAGAGTGFHHATNLQHHLNFGQSAAFAQPATYASTSEFVENEYVDLGGYYGLFENRNVAFDASTVDPSWAFMDPSMSHRGGMNSSMGANHGM